MARMPKLVVLFGTLLGSGCGHYDRVVVETRVVVFAPAPISVSSKIDLTKSEQKEKTDAPQRHGEIPAAYGTP